MFSSPVRVRHGVWRLAALMCVACLPQLSGDAHAGLLDELRRQVENAARNLPGKLSRDAGTCGADDKNCPRDAAKPGKEQRPPPAAAAVPAPSAEPRSDSHVRLDANPYLDHELKDHPAYLLANQLTDAKTEQEVVDLMRQAFDRINLGIYTPEGRQLLSGAERKPTDFFLYDFQWKILARAFWLRNSTSFDGHAKLLGVALLGLKDPSPFPEVLGQAIEQRFELAVRNILKGGDPADFIVLLIDGLARRQPIPYALYEPFRFADPRIRVDPLQSLLMALEFLSRPPAKRGKLSFDWLPSLIPVAHAQSPCDLIKGDDEQGYWGRGTDILGEVGQNLPGAIGKSISALGNATGVAGALGDLLVLYGMNIRLTPQPYVIHLLHPGEGAIAAIEADVTFDSQGVPDSVLKCGWLAGKQMPANGGLKDVELTWDFSPVLQPKLAVHSSMFDGYGNKNAKGNHIIGTSGGLRTLTDDFGKSIFVIQPGVCPVPSGKIVEKNYMASVDARFVTRSPPTPGMLGFGLILKLGPGALEYLMHGRSAYVRFAAQWHEKPPPPPQY